MKKLTRIRLTDVGLYANLDFDLGKPGITFIGGRNKDAGPAPDLSNGAGKTMMARAISELLLEQSPLTGNVKSKAKKDLFSRKTSSATLDFVSEGVEYSYKKKRKGTGFEVEVHENGENVHVHTKTYAEEKLSKELPWDVDFFYSFIHLDSRKHSLLQLGTQTVRLEFFTRLFHLEGYDETRDKINKLLTEAKRSGAKLEEVKLQLSPVEDDILSSEERERLERDVEHHTDVLNNLGKKRAALVRFQAASNVVQRWQDSAVSLADKCGKLLKKELYDNNMEQEDVQQALSQSQALIRKHVQSQKAFASFSTWENTKQRLETELASIQDSLDAEYEAQPDLKGLTIRELQEDIQASQRLKQDVTLAENRAKRADPANSGNPTPKELEDSIALLESEIEGKDLTDVQASVAAAQGGISHNRQILQVLSKAFGHAHEDNVECPTCFATLSTESIQIMEEGCQTQIEQFTVQLEAGKAIQKKFAQLDKLDVDLEAANRAVQEHALLLLAFQAASDKYEEFGIMDTSVYSEVITLIQNLNNATRQVQCHAEDKPVLPENYNDEKSRRLTETLREFGQAAQEYMPNVTSFLNALDELKDAPTDEAIDVELEQIYADTQVSNRVLPDLKTKLSMDERNRDTVEDLTKRFDELKAQTDDLPILDALQYCFSNKGLKAIRAARIGERVAANLNTYSHLLFNEKTTFSFVIEENSFDILFSRQVKDAAGALMNTEPTDVRNLSGAESRAFNLLLPLAMLPLIPSGTRPNVMILDEPTANMDPATIELFLRSYLPRLNKLVEHVIVISPILEEITGASYYTVVKENGVSTMVPGSPLSLFDKKMSVENLMADLLQVAE